VKGNNKQLVLKLQFDNDPEAFSELYDRFAEPIYRFIYFKVGSRVDAQDLTSEVFLKAWAAIREKKEGVLNFRAFLYRIARNLVVDFYRAKRQNTSIEAIDPDAIMVSANIDRIANNQELSVVLKAVRSLKDEYRELIIFRFMDQMSYKEIGQILNKSQVTVRVTMHRAVKTLKRHLGATEEPKNSSPQQS
tara:strand:- start:574 stop:1146 length:573 start_codon:yes stop_codon:yes gene_type:complete